MKSDPQDPHTTHETIVWPYDDQKMATTPHESHVFPIDLDIEFNTEIST